ncbi:hypothetical protein [Ferrimicrobium sp.]|uniref:hypothetical protein n=1 Tax=Ferrimicrobium sp. TaxID=2926050 RepID=UPI0026279EE8|nr:hypothetical protein [Ferrimicrobium sp.]
MPDKPLIPPGSPNGGQFGGKKRRSQLAQVKPKYESYQDVVDTLIDHEIEPMDCVAYHYTNPHNYESEDYYCPKCAVKYADAVLGEDIVAEQPDEVYRTNEVLSPELKAESVGCQGCGMIFTSSLGYAGDPSWKSVALTRDGQLMGAETWRAALWFHGDKFTPEFKQYMRRRSPEFRKIEDEYSRLH